MLASGRSSSRQILEVRREEEHRWASGGRKRSGVTGVFRLLSAPCANKLKRGYPETLIWPKERGETVRSSSAVWPVMLVVAVLGFAFGGCGTLSSSLLSESSVLGSRAPVAAPVVQPTQIAATVEAPTTL